MDLAHIEPLAKSYAEHRAALSQLVQALNADLATLKAARLPPIKKALAKMDDAKAALRTAVEQAPDCFVEPRTCVFHDIKVGYRLGQPKLEWDDDVKLIERIKRYLSRTMQKMVLKVVESPRLAAL